jgi:carbon-monoxide dehydrogenase medium subunit
MHLPKFEYLKPVTLEETYSLLEKGNNAVKVIAGGTDVLVKMKNRRLLPSRLISIKNIQGLDYIIQKDGKVFIGALTSLEDVATSSLVKEKLPILAQAAGMVGSRAIRNQGTIGGNLCNAAPSAETAPALIVLGASVKLASPAGERVVPLESFFTGPGKTVLKSNELLVEIQVPIPVKGSGGEYLKCSLRQLDIATVGVAAQVLLENGICTDIKIVLGAVAPTPIRATSAETVLRGKKPEKALYQEAADRAVNDSRPITDIRGTAEARRGNVRLLTAQAVETAVARAKVGGK